MNSQQQNLPDPFPRYRMAQLLSLTQAEFGMLQHKGLSAVMNKAGDVIGYCMRLSRKNSKELLSRVKCDKRMQVYFDALRLEIDI